MSTTGCCARIGRRTRLKVHPQTPGPDATSGHTPFSAALLGAAAQDSLNPVDGNAVPRVAVPAGHRLGTQHGVDDGLLGGLDRTPVFSGIPANSKFFDIANGTAGTESSTATSTGVTVVLTAAGYASTSPSTTPLTGNPTATVGSSSSFVVSSDVDARTFTLLGAANATTTATFQYRFSFPEGSISITDNVITNAQTGITLSNIDTSDADVTIPTISRIDFINNTEAVKLQRVDSNVTIPVSDSYWGTTDLGAISDLIYDNLDDFNLGTVQVVSPVASPIHP